MSAQDNLSPQQFEPEVLGHSAAMDAVEEAFSKHAAWSDGTPNPSERTKNLMYAATMTGFKGTSYIDAVDHLARKHNDIASITALPGRAARARS
jgi:hypothetical protein